LTVCVSTFQGRLIPGYWSRGKFYPVIMGGSGEGGGDAGGNSSGGDAATAVVGMLDAANDPGTEGTDSKSSAGTKGGTKSQESTDNSFAREVLGSLEGISDAERPILEKYLSGIDSQITQRFQGIHDEYSAFKDYKDNPDSVKQAMEVVQLMETNPAYVMNVLAQEMPDEYWESLGGEEEGAEELETEENEYEGLPKALVERLDKHDRLIEAMAEMLMTGQQAQKEAEEDAQIETELKELHKKHGDFDEEAVLSYAVAQEIDLPEAVEWYTKFIDGIKQSVTAPEPPVDNSPPVLSGGGNPPSSVPDVTKMDGKDTRSLVAQILAASNLEE
jgi:hypothetical protein